ncbi:hypothetical protein PV326_012669, partial [Microctonus aethiopoides]
DHVITVTPKIFSLQGMDTRDSELQNLFFGNSIRPFFTETQPNNFNLSAITTFITKFNIVASMGESKDDLYYVEFHIYNRQNSTPHILTSSNELTLLFSSFEKKPSTIIYIHGWLGSRNTEGGQMIRDAYLKFADCNVILVDWSNAAGKFYFEAASSIKKIGRNIAEMIAYQWIANRIDRKSLHIIGFSLGAHVAGFVGKELAPLTVPRITGLDPAGPEFISKPPYRRLDKSDAEFVDVIHTESNAAGTWQPLGHVDFYPNSGQEQKGCKWYDFPCNHKMAYKFYTQSISNPAKFVGLRCDLYINEFDKEFKNCRKEEIIVMGHGANPHVHGVFLVNTEYHQHAWFYYAESVLNERGFSASKWQEWKPNINTCTKNPDAFMGFIANSQI